MTVHINVPYQKPEKQKNRKIEQLMEDYRETRFPDSANVETQEANESCTVAYTESEVI